VSDADAVQVRNCTQNLLANVDGILFRVVALVHNTIEQFTTINTVVKQRQKPGKKKKKKKK